MSGRDERPQKLILETELPISTIRVLKKRLVEVVKRFEPVELSMLIRWMYVQQQFRDIPKSKRAELARYFISCAEEVGVLMVFMGRVSIGERIDEWAR